MAGHARHTYVLVAGAWHGGWIWRDVAARLRAAGHTVGTPTLTGLGERRHLGADVDLDAHVEDVVAHVEMEGHTNITLVGWSYGGMVITGVLARIPNRIRSMIYLDAFAPEDGEALVDYLDPRDRVAWDEIKCADGLLPPISVERLGLRERAHIDFVLPRLVGQPWRTFYQSVRALNRRPDIPIAYIYCASDTPSPFAAILETMEKDPGVRTDTIRSGHTCMLTAPEETIRLLEKYA